MDRSPDHITIIVRTRCDEPGIQTELKVINWNEKKLRNPFPKKGIRWKVKRAPMRYQ
jgi:hypothetical protein